MLRAINPMSLLLIFFIILMLFGTKRLKTIGTDLATAIRSFRKGLEQESETEATQIKSHKADEE